MARGSGSVVLIRKESADGVIVIESLERKKTLFASLQTNDPALLALT